MSGAAFKDLLTTVEPRELSGSRSSNRFDYQKDWTLCLLLQLHTKDDDYLVLLDYHDDVVVLNSSSAPTGASFFQVKTNAGNNWTLRQLTARKKGKQGLLPSHLGKLWSHQVSFATGACACFFVTNGSFKFCASLIADELGDKATCDDLEASDLSTLANAIKDELNLGTLPPLTLGKRLSFVRTSLSVQDHSDHATGKLVKFVDARHPTGKFNAASAYKALADEIKRRADREGLFASYDLLAAKKGVSRAAFEQMLQAIGAVDDLDVVWTRYENQLQTEGIPFSELQAVRSAWRQHEIERMDVANEDLRALRIVAATEVANFLQANPSYALAELVRSCLTRLTQTTPTHPAHYLQAVVLMEHHDVTKVQEADPKSQATPS